MLPVLSLVVCSEDSTHPTRQQDLDEFAIQYHEQCGSFPPAYTVDANGRRLHSWRTLILPLLDEAALFKKIDLSKPWDDEKNREALATHVAAYSCPAGDLPKFQTTYVVIVDPNGFFPGATPQSLGECSDPQENTLLLMEAPQDQAVHWMAPTDVDLPVLLGISSRSKLMHQGGIHVVTSDGAIRNLSTESTNAMRRGLVTIHGNESIGNW